jgi:hypothetical protein
VFEFFFVFSRFEYALLNTGYIAERKGGAFADWDRFARDHDQIFISDQIEQLQKAVRYYEEHPPMKQVVESGMLTVREAIPQDKERLVRLLILVRRVRNNLFHGEKFKALLEGDSARDKDLLEHGLTILHACLKLRADITDRFYSDARWELNDVQEQEEAD